MKTNTKHAFSNWMCRAAIAIVAIGIAVAPAVSAKPKPKKTAAEPVNVVAHLELSGSSATQMLLVKKDGRQYLLIALDSPSRVVVLDVSDPGGPHTMQAAAGTSGASAAELKIVSDTLTLFGTSEAEASPSSQPKEIRGLPGVTVFTRDKVRDLIYFTNGDGLWIVKTRQRADADAAFDNYSG